MWKKFGRENDVGKMLFSLYGAREKPKIEYPVVKTKVRVEQPKEEKKCPQKTQVEYPEPRRKAGPKYHPIDFVQKRKGQEEIQAEIQTELSRPLQAPLKRGVNRKQMINDLQENFQFKDKAELDAYIAQKKQLALL